MGGARAIPEQIQDSVNALMDAMRHLLIDPIAGHQQQRVGGDEEIDNEGEWEDDDEHDQR